VQTTTPRPPETIVEAEGVGPSSAAYRAAALPLSYASACAVEVEGVAPSSVAYKATALLLSYTSRFAWCSRLESNQHLLRFRQAPSPDRLREQRRGRDGARPRASSTIRLSKIDPGRRRVGSGMRSRTSINRVKTCRPAVSRSPSGLFRFVSGPGVEPGFLRSERSGLPLADPEQRGPARNRTPLARVRTECFAVKASGPLRRDRVVPSVGLEPTQAGLKGRCPSRWASTANDRRRRV
jgi:hypothetical protein